jgi:lysine-N-methylase
MIALMQNRQFTISQRLRKLGHVCERLEAEGANEGCVDLRKIVESQDGINPSVSMPATARFEAVIELILARIGSDATSKRFLDCYRNLMSGLHWTMESTMEDLAARLESAQRGIYAQFLAEHSYILENYLVVYIFRGLFPFGSESVNRKFADYGFKNSVTHHYQMMIADFAVIDTMMSGLAAFYGERFNLSEALKVIQSATKTFEHSISYPGKALELLAGKGMVDCRSMGMLIRD